MGILAWLLSSSEAPQIVFMLDNLFWDNQEEKRIDEDNARLQECQDTKNKLKSVVEKLKLATLSLTTATKDAEMEVIQV